MRDLCNTDKPLFAVLTKLTYSAYLNILWLVCSLPIVTIGASTTALFYVTLKMAEDRDDGLTRMFFKAFRENFKPATKLWLILLAGAICVGFAGFDEYHQSFVADRGPSVRDVGIDSIGVTAGILLVQAFCWSTLHNPSGKRRRRKRR